MKDESARIVRLDAERDSDGQPREAGDGPWGAAAPGEVSFRDAGIAASSKVVPIVECLRDNNSVVGEELRLLAANLIEMGRHRKMNCLALSSALPGEGKSTISVGLASALAREPGRRVLLVEADLRRPSLTPTLGVPRAPGLGEWLSGALDNVPLRVVEPGGFYFLAAGQVGLKRPESLGSPRMDALLRTSRGLFDFVILDAVPLLPVADAVLMQDLVDGFLLVVRSRQTPRHAIHDAVARLRSDRVIGVVLNDHHEYRGSYKGYAYRGYGMDAGTGYGSPPPSERPQKPSGSGGSRRR